MPLVTGGTASINDSTDFFIFVLSMLEVAVEGGITSLPFDLAAAPADLRMIMLTLHSLRCQFVEHANLDLKFILPTVREGTLMPEERLCRSSKTRAAIGCGGNDFVNV